MSRPKQASIAAFLIVALSVPAAIASGEDATAMDGAPQGPEVVVLEAGAQPRHELRYDLIEGQTEGFAMTAGGAGRVTDQGTRSPWVETPAMTFTGTSTVTAANEDGTYDIEMVIAEVAMTDDDVDPAVAEQLRAQMEGLTMRYRIDERGRVLQSETTATPGALAAGFQPGLIDSLSVQMVQPLPSEPVGVGAVWDVRSEAIDPSLGYTMVTTTTTTFDALRPDGTFELSGEGRIGSPDQELVIPGMPDSFKATLDELAGEVSYRWVIDPTKVVVGVEGGSTVVFAMTIDTGDGAQSSEMEMRMDMSQEPTTVVAADSDATAPPAAGSQAPTLSTPEDAIKEYLAGVADADVGRILGATAVDEVSEGFRFDLYSDRIYAFYPQAQYAPSEHLFFADITRALQAAKILDQVRMLAYSLLSEAPIGSEAVPGTELEPDPLHWGQEFVRQVDPSRLAGITLIDIVQPDPERADSEMMRSLYAKQQATLGADEVSERLAIISFEGETYAVGFTLLRYGDEWFVNLQSSPVAGTDPIGIAMPYTVEE